MGLRMRSLCRRRSWCGKGIKKPGRAGLASNFIQDVLNSCIARQISSCVSPSQSGTVASSFSSCFKNYSFGGLFGAVNRYKINALFLS